MHRNGKADAGVLTTRHAATALLVAAATLLAGCERGSTSDTADAITTGPSGCPEAHARAQAAVKQAEKTDIPWDGPTSGPTAVPGKTIVYVAQTMTNPGVAGAAQGVRNAAAVIGWNIRVIDGGGTPAGIQAAMSEAVTLKPAGIVIGGFDPNSTSQQVSRANAAGIPLIGWHAVATPGPSKKPRLFTNVTTRVDDVSAISARWIIAHSNGHAGVVIITDASILFARSKSELIKKELATCAGVKLLAYENIPIPDASNRTPRQISSLLSRFQGRWTHSAAINDLYFADAAPAFRAAGKPGSGPRSTSAPVTAIPRPSSASTASSTRPPPSPSR